jgi:hypothetical protein
MDIASITRQVAGGEREASTEEGHGDRMARVRQACQEACARDWGPRSYRCDSRERRPLEMYTPRLHDGQQVKEADQINALGCPLKQPDDPSWKPPRSEKGLNVRAGPLGD